jgi:hypothetical protein
MKKSHESGLATHIGPESCGAARRVRELLRDADAVGVCGRLHRVHRNREVRQSPARSETPCTYADTSHGNREIPGRPRAAVALGRIGKSKDARR